jgi:hypothetical protein
MKIGSENDEISSIDRASSDEVFPLNDSAERMFELDELEKRLEMQQFPVGGIHDEAAMSCYSDRCDQVCDSYCQGGYCGQGVYCGTTNCGCYDIHCTGGYCDWDCPQLCVNQCTSDCDDGGW